MFKKLYIMHFNKFFSELIGYVDEIDGPKIVGKKSKLQIVKIYIK